MAKNNNLKQEDMVKRVFVFSDMHFNHASGRPDVWSTSYQRVVGKFKEAGYEMPELVFWNLAGGRGHGAPKPVTSDEPGTALVSGYSQGMLKVFLDGGGFEDPAEEETIVTEETADADGGAVKVTKEQKKTDPASLVKKAISHKSYSMLEVVD
jgi:hypothetical protein